MGEEGGSSIVTRSTIQVRTTTHSAKGLSSRDIELALVFDKLASTVSIPLEDGERACEDCSHTP
jgi:hypothetical protein